MTAEGPDPGAVRKVLADALGDDPGELALTTIPGGASRETYLVERVDPVAGDADQRGAGGPAGPPRWVLRLDPSGAESFLPLAVEHGVVSTAAAAGVPVPRPLGFEPAGGQFGNAGYLMEHVEGTSVPPRVLRRDELAAARERLPTQLAESLARIHAIDPARIAGVTGGDRDPALEACELWERELDAVGEPLPAVEAGLRSLRLDPPPAPDRVALVHGDFRLGNFIVDGEGLAAVIDWELCHAGDPADDIGWLVIRSWRFGNDGLPVAGLGELEPLLAAYEAAGGARPSADRLRWWEAMGNVKWAVICARQAHDHLSGTRPSAELASLGRRICEPEWDLLELLATPDATGAGAASGAPEES